MNGVEFAALYTLQHRLASDAESPGGLKHRNVTWRCLLHELGAEGVVDAEAPRGAGRDLLAVDESIVKPAMDR